MIFKDISNEVRKKNNDLNKDFTTFWQVHAPTAHQVYSLARYFYQPQAESNFAVGSSSSSFLFRRLLLFSQF